jgi:hypothetical protein
MSSKQYGAQINALMHGAQSIGNFTLPPNIELVTFNKPEFTLDILHVIKIFDTLRQIPLSRRIKSQVLKSDISDLYVKYKLNYGPDYEKYKTMNIRITDYKPNETGVPNLQQSFEDTTNKKKVLGFYETNDASITYIRENSNKTKINVNSNEAIMNVNSNDTKMNVNANYNRGEYIPQSGFLQNSYKDFINYKLQGNKNLYFTTEQLVEYIALKANILFPGKVIRVFLLCCRTDKDNSTDEDMAVRYLENISSETISSELAEQPMLVESAVETIIRKRKRSSAQIKIGNKSAKIRKISQNRVPKKTQKRRFSTFAKTKKKKKSGR